MGRAYTIFETAIGRCGIAWGDAGVLAMQLPDVRELDTRRNLLRRCPDARETMRPPREIETTIDGVTALLRGQPADFSDVVLDFSDMVAFNQRIYLAVRTIPYGETRTHAEIAAHLGASGAYHAVGHALARNPFTLIVPCHRARPTAGDVSGRPFNGGIVSSHRLLSIEGVITKSSMSLFDVLLREARPPQHT